MLKSWERTSCKIGGPVLGTPVGNSFDDTRCCNGGTCTLVAARRRCSGCCLGLLLLLDSLRQTTGVVVCHVAQQNGRLCRAENVRDSCRCLWKHVVT